MDRKEAGRQYALYIEEKKKEVRKVVEMIESHFNIKNSYCDTIAFFPFGSQRLLIFQLTGGDKDKKDKSYNKWMVTMHLCNGYINHHGPDGQVWFEDPVEAFKPAFVFARKLLQDLTQEIPSV